MSSQNNLLRFNWMLQTKRRQVLFWAQVGNRYLSLYLKPFMWGQRLTGACELAKCHDTNQQRIQDLTFMQKVVSCVTSLWPKTNTLANVSSMSHKGFHKIWNGWWLHKGPQRTDKMEGSCMLAKEFTVPYNEFIEHNWFLVVKHNIFWYTHSVVAHKWGALNY